MKKVTSSYTYIVLTIGLLLTNSIINTAQNLTTAAAGYRAAGTSFNKPIQNPQDPQQIQRFYEGLERRVKDAEELLKNNLPESSLFTTALLECQTAYFKIKTILGTLMQTPLPSFQELNQLNQSYQEMVRTARNTLVSQRSKIQRATGSSPISTQPASSSWWGRGKQRVHTSAAQQNAIQIILLALIDTLIGATKHTEDAWNKVRTQPSKSPTRPSRQTISSSTIPAAPTPLAASTEAAEPLSGAQAATETTPAQPLSVQESAPTQEAGISEPEEISIMPHPEPTQPTEPEPSQPSSTTPPSSPAPIALPVLPPAPAPIALPSVPQEDHDQQFTMQPIQKPVSIQPVSGHPIPGGETEEITNPVEQPENPIITQPTIPEEQSMIGQPVEELSTMPRSGKKSGRKEPKKPSELSIPEAPPVPKMPSKKSGKSAEPTPTNPPEAPSRKPSRSTPIPVIPAAPHVSETPPSPEKTSPSPSKSSKLPKAEKPESPRKSREILPTPAPTPEQTQEKSASTKNKSKESKRGRTQQDSQDSGETSSE